MVRSAGHSRVDGGCIGPGTATGKGEGVVVNAPPSSSPDGDVFVACYLGADGNAGNRGFANDARQRAQIGPVARGDGG